MNLACVPVFQTSLYLDTVLYHSLQHQYIEKSESAAVDSHGISKLSKQKLSPILKVKTSFEFAKPKTIISGVDFLFSRN